MSWWGKIIGGAFGYLIGGPLGALLGSALGHQFDTGIKRIGRESAQASVGDQERTQTAFFTATFSVMGYVAKADGRITPEEIHLANDVMGRMQLDADQRRAARELFRQGRDPGFPIDQVIDQFRIECHRRTNLVRMFLEIQIEAALADGRLHGAEGTVLADIAEALGFHRADFQRLLRMMEAAIGAGAGRRTARPGAPGLAEDYRLLGVSQTATDDEIKRAYRRLMNQHHPDKLVAKGLPEEMTRIATEKTQAIRAAYERVRQSRSRAAV